MAIMMATHGHHDGNPLVAIMMATHGHHDGHPMAITMATHGHHDGNPWPLPSGWQPLWPGALPLPHGGTLPHSLTGPRAGWGAGNVGGFLFATAWRSRNPRGENFFYCFSPRTFPPETCAERSFSKSFSPRMSCPERQFADVTSRNLRKMAHNSYVGGLAEPLRTR